MLGITLCALVQAYVAELGTCLSKLEQEHGCDDPANPLLQQLQKWALECGLLLIATGFSSPSNLQRLYHCNFAEASVVEQDLPGTFYQGLLVRDAFRLFTQGCAYCVADMLCSCALVDVKSACTLVTVLAVLCRALLIWLGSHDRALHCNACRASCQHGLRQA